MYWIDRRFALKTLWARQETTARALLPHVLSQVYSLHHSPGDPVLFAADTCFAALRLADWSCLFVLPPFSERALQLFNTKTAATDMASESELTDSGRAQTLLKKEWFVPLSSQLQSAVNLFLTMTAEITVRDVFPSGDSPMRPEARLAQQQHNGRTSDEDVRKLIAGIPTVHNHNQYRLEVAWQEAIRAGDLLALNKAFQIPTIGEEGMLGPTKLRSLINHANLMNVLSSRAAIAAGVSVEDAYTLSDKLFIAAERCTTEDEALAMRYYITKAFTLQVRQYKDQEGESLKPTAVSVAMDYVKKHIYDKFTLSDIANAAGVSTAALEKSFRRATGQPLGTYIQAERLKIARDLLVNTDTKIGEIAELLGFADTGHFCRVFRKTNALTPLRYRQILRRGA